MTDWIVAICSIISVVIAGLTLYQVYIQLKGLNASLKNSTLMTLIELENEIISRKSVWDEANFDIRKYELELEKSDKKPEGKLLKLLIDKEKTTLENYINSIDRLAYCILNKYLSERDWRTEYRDVIFDLVERKNNEFGVSSRYRNTIKIYNKWKDN